MTKKQDPLDRLTGARRVMNERRTMQELVKEDAMSSEAANIAKPKDEAKEERGSPPPGSKRATRTSH